MTGVIPAVKITMYKQTRAFILVIKLPPPALVPSSPIVGDESMKMMSSSTPTITYPLSLRLLLSTPLPQSVTLKMMSSSTPTNPYYLNEFIAMLNGVTDYYATGSESAATYNTTDVWGRILALNTDFRSVRACRARRALAHLLGLSDTRLVSKIRAPPGWWLVVYIPLPHLPVF